MQAFGLGNPALGNLEFRCWRFRFERLRKDNRPPAAGHVNQSVASQRVDRPMCSPYGHEMRSGQRGNRRQVFTCAQLAGRNLPTEVRCNHFVRVLKGPRREYRAGDEGGHRGCSTTVRLVDPSGVHT